MKTTGALVRGAAASALLLLLAGCGGPALSPDLAASSADPRSVEYFQVKVGDTIFFTTDSSELTPSALQVLDQQAAWLAANPSVSVRLEGHADERGTREYNIALGARRANTVAAYLISKGVAQGRIKTVSFGREKPLTSCPEEDCWARNRRVQTLPR